MQGTALRKYLLPMVSIDVVEILAVGLRLHTLEVEQGISPVFLDPSFEE
jgi:hypothetical protein